MKRALSLWPLVVLALLPATATARPVDRATRIVIEAEPRGGEPVRGSGLVIPLSGGVFLDTVFYGGTCWAPDSMRWEALRDSVWTFDTGVGSAFGDTGPNKPAGYHTRMEGWYGIDNTLVIQPWFRRSTTCAIAGSWSFWAGVTLAEAESFCYAAGQGYGNLWSLVIRKTFSYPGSGNATLSYQYAADVEPGFDYAYALIDTSGTGAVDDIVLRTHTGAIAGTETVPLVPGTTLPTSAGPIAIKFKVTSDAAYSDEDGVYPTTCGAFAADNVQLTGAITDYSDFESGADGWSQYIPTTGVGDYTNIVNLDTDLPPPVTFCPCGLRDSVLVFHDLLGQHPLDQDNLAVSPWIDLKRGGDAGRPGKLILYDIYRDLPVANYIYYQATARYYPAVCLPTGKLYTTAWLYPPIFFYDTEPSGCNTAGIRRFRDYSGMIAPTAEQIQIAFVVVNLCRTAPLGVPCTGLTNTTPWIDNVSLGVFGPAAAPIVVITTLDMLQDNFATDGTLNPASTGRLDVNRIKNGSTPGPGTILGDTLVVGGNGGNTEVRLVFHVRPGPFTSPLALAIHSTRWTAEPGIGPGWYSARMDTAEQGGTPTIGKWMATFHESEHGFHGTDRLADPLDPSQLENEILPDHILTPGSRIDYFVESRYIPPDPRNPGGATWYVTPDTTGGRYLEVEILPSSMAADTTWNCALYVDHHDDREFAAQRLEEEGLTAALGTGGANAEGTRFDRYDVETPSSGQLSFGRPIRTNYGATAVQAFAYKMIAWHSGSLSSYQLTAEDADVLGPWLTLQSIGGNRFWGSGDGLVRSMWDSHSASATAFMRNVLGVCFTCNTIRDADCPVASSLDSTFCVPLLTVVGAEFTTTVASSARGNGCPDLRSFDVIKSNTAVTTALHQLDYQKNGGAFSCFSVTNRVETAGNYRTVVDGAGVGQLRTTPPDPHIQALCTETAASLQRAADVLGWFGAPLLCRTPAGLVDVPGRPPEPPRYRAELGPAAPNPMARNTRISFVNASPGPVTLQVFDVTGRLVRSLVSGPLPAGPQEVAWDGTADNGAQVPNGMYFYRMTATWFAASRKLLVLR